MPCTPTGNGVGLILRGCTSQCACSGELELHSCTVSMVLLLKFPMPTKLHGVSAASLQLRETRFCLVLKNLLSRPMWFKHNELLVLDEKLVVRDYRKGTASASTPSLGKTAELPWEHIFPQYHNLPSTTMSAIQHPTRTPALNSAPSPLAQAHRSMRAHTGTDDSVLHWLGGPSTAEPELCTKRGKSSRKMLSIFTIWCQSKATSTTASPKKIKGC